MRLGEQLWTREHKWRATYDERQDRHYQRCELEEPFALTAKLKQMGAGRVEVVVRNTNLQAVMDMSDPAMRPRGKRVQRGEMTEENKQRSLARSRQTVRIICQRIEADRMGTFGTRSVIPLEVLMTRFQRFVARYEYSTKTKLKYCAVPELHPNGLPGHYHLHVAFAGWFQLGIALPIWHALCDADDKDHEVNGSINIKQFRVRSLTDDVPSVIASYIAKYVGKSLDAGFNKRKYWATRLPAVEVDYKILKAATWQEAMNELSALLGFEFSSVVMTHRGCFFAFPEDRGFWFKLTPSMARAAVPF